MKFKKSVPGFSLIEILVALIIIGVILSFVAPVVLNRPEHARDLKIKNDFAAISMALELYKLDHSKLPNSDQGFEVLTVNNGSGYLKEVPTDPWGTPYRFDYLNAGLMIRSAGPDGKFDDTKDGDDRLSEVITN